MKDNDRQKPENWNETLNEGKNGKIMGNDQPPNEANFYSGFPVKKEKPSKVSSIALFIFFILSLVTLASIFLYSPGD